MGLPPLQKLSKLATSHLSRPRRFFASSSNFLQKVFSSNLQVTHILPNLLTTYFQLHAIFMPKNMLLHAFRTPEAQRCPKSFQKTPEGGLYKLEFAYFTKLNYM